MREKKKQRIVVISFTRQGFLLSQRMREALQDSRGLLQEEERTADSCEVTLYTRKETVAHEFSDAVWVDQPLQRWCESVFSESEVLIFIGASGIAVRTIAPFLVSKVQDPAVLVADEKGQHLISLLSGHLGGGNEFTLRLADALGSDPVITTASDVNRRLAIDVWAQKNQCMITDLKAAKMVAAEIVEGKKIPFVTDVILKGTLPEEFIPKPPMTQTAEMETEGDFQHQASGSMSVVVSDFRPKRKDDSSLYLIPRIVVLGIGCRKGKSYEEIRGVLYQVLEEYDVFPDSICQMASIDLKKGEEGLLQLSRELGVPFETFPKEALLQVPGSFTSSDFVSEITGVNNVCERAAMACLTPEEQKEAVYLCRKTAKDGVTVALLQKPWKLR